MSAMLFEITTSSVCSTVCSDWQQKENRHLGINNIFWGGHTGDWRIPENAAIGAKGVSTSLYQHDDKPWYNHRHVCYSIVAWSSAMYNYTCIKYNCVLQGDTFVVKRALWCHGMSAYIVDYHRQIWKPFRQTTSRDKPYLSFPALGLLSLSIIVMRDNTSLVSSTKPLWQWFAS